MTRAMTKPSLLAYVANKSCALEIVLKKATRTAGDGVAHPKPLTQSRISDLKRSQKWTEHN